jgi:hypothetical protein
MPLDNRKRPLSEQNYGRLTDKRPEKKHMMDTGIRLLDYLVFREVRMLLRADQISSCLSISEAAIHQSMEGKMCLIKINSNNIFLFVRYNTYF